MKRSSLSFLLLLSLLTSAWAETLETPFYKVEVPSGWRMERGLTGLWEFQPEDESFLRATVSVNRLRTRTEYYLQGVVRLWAARGEVSVLENASDPKKQLIVFLVKLKGDDGLAELKLARWREELMVTTSFVVPLEKVEQVLPQGQRFTGNMEIKKPDYQPWMLVDFVRTALAKHSNSREELSELPVVKLEMTSFRQDWEPYFPHQKPGLYEAFRAYLEARFDAAYVVSNREQLGMPESRVEERLRAVEDRKSELMKVLEAEPELPELQVPETAE